MYLIFYCDFACYLSKNCNMLHVSYHYYLLIIFNNHIKSRIIQITIKSIYYTIQQILIDHFLLQLYSAFISTYVTITTRNNNHNVTYQFIRYTRPRLSNCCRICDRNTNNCNIAYWTRLINAITVIGLLCLTRNEYFNYVPVLKTNDNG